MKSKCPKCGTEVSFSAKKCAACGAKIDQKVTKGCALGCLVLLLAPFLLWGGCTVLKHLNVAISSHEANQKSFIARGVSCINLNAQILNRELSSRKMEDALIHASNSLTAALKAPEIIRTLKDYTRMAEFLQSETLTCIDDAAKTYKITDEEKNKFIKYFEQKIHHYPKLQKHPIINPDTDYIFASICTPPSDEDEMTRTSEELENGRQAIPDELRSQK